MVGGIKCTAGNLNLVAASACCQIDYSEDFFGKPSYLTVSGQLNGEYYACALSNVYTFGEWMPGCNRSCNRLRTTGWHLGQR